MNSNSEELSPEVAPEENPEIVPEESPEATPGESPEETPEVTAEERSENAPVESPDETQPVSIDDTPEEKPRHWRALVLGGGGARGEFEVGAVEALVDHGWEFDFFAGISAGALNVSMLAQYERLEDGLIALQGFWDGITRRQDVMTGWTPLGVLRSFAGKGRLIRDYIWNSEPLAEKVRKNVSWDALEKSGKKIAVGAVSLNDARYYLITNDETLHKEYSGGGRTLELTLEKGASASIPDNYPEFVLASATIPWMMRPVDLFNHRFFDGGLRQNTPLRSALMAADHAEADEITIVVVSPQPDDLNLTGQTQLNSGLEIHLRTLDIMTHETMENDIVQIESGNLQAFSFSPALLQKLKIIMVRPVEYLGYANKDFEKVELRKRARILGKEAMEEELENYTPY